MTRKYVYVACCLECNGLLKDAIADNKFCSNIECKLYLKFVTNWYNFESEVS